MTVITIAIVIVCIGGWHWERRRQRPPWYRVPASVASMSGEDILFVSVFGAIGSVVLPAGIVGIVNSVVSGSDAWLFLALFTFMCGGIPLLLAAGHVVAHRRSRRAWTWLQTHGWRIQAAYTGTVRNVDEDGRRWGWRVTARWQDPKTNVVHDFKSRDFTFDPSPFLRTPTLDVLVDPRDPTVYMIDLDPLLTEMRRPG